MRFDLSIDQLNRLQRGCTYLELARECGVAPSTVRTAAIRAGYVGPGSGAKSKRGPKFAPIFAEKEKGTKALAVAERFGVTVQRVRQIWKAGSSGCQSTSQG